MSLRELARHTEVTASFLSQLERGQSDTSIGVLRRISEVLGVPMMHFLADSRQHLARTALTRRTLGRVYGARERLERLLFWRPSTTELYAP